MKKNIKELGLELILIGDNILLIDINRKPLIGETGYCNEGTWNGTLALIENEPITDVWVKIVGSKKVLGGGIPLLDIEDEVNHLINEIPKKELWIEVELEGIKVSDKTGYEQLMIIPKIENNKIKAIWK
jgi:hypothetical protein